jgi:hypothetical protein
MSDANSTRDRFKVIDRLRQDSVRFGEDTFLSLQRVAQILHLQDCMDSRLRK